MSQPIKLQPGEVAKIDQPERWETRFDEQFKQRLIRIRDGDFITPVLFDMKDFIRDLLAEQRSQLLVDWFGDNYPNTIEKLQ
jgi:hypothetical protein